MISLTEKTNETVEGRLVDHHTMIIIAIVTMNICECPRFDPWFWSMSKTCNPDLVYSNLAGWISYDLICFPNLFSFWFSQIHPLKRLNLEGIYPWWSRECQVQPKMCRMLRGCCGLGSECNLTLKVHPWKLTWNQKITQLKRKIIFQNLHFWVPAVSFPGCIGLWLS